MLSGKILWRCEPEGPGGRAESQYFSRLHESYYGIVYIIYYREFMPFFKKKFNTRPIDQIHKNIWMFVYNFNISIDHQSFIYSLYNQNIHYLLVLNWSDGIYISVGYICFSYFYAADIISLSELKVVFGSEKYCG